jgi:hypothetical protein
MVVIVEIVVWVVLDGPEAIYLIVVVVIVADKHVRRQCELLSA